MYESGNTRTAHGKEIFGPMAKILVARRLLVMRQTVKSTVIKRNVAENRAFAFIISFLSGTCYT